MKRDEVVKYLDKVLLMKRFSKKWKESNGLIVKGNDEVKKVCLAVNVSSESIEKAMKSKVNFLITHHTAWKWMPDYKEKLALLKKNGISLYVAHESLDQAKEIGMAYTLAKSLGIKIKGRFYKEKKDVDYTGAYGYVDFSFDEMVKRIIKTLKVKPTVFRNNKKFKRVGIITGGADRINYISAVLNAGCDTYLTGQSAMFGNIFAKENRLNYISATHYATEAICMMNFAKIIKNKLRTKTIFINEENLG
jgi:dinuclear metal center YbgI/SA1388 family protein